jgi:four helix bundle protein
MKLAGEVYRCTDMLPKNELYGLTSQIRRAAVSVASNIAEGKGHRSNREFLHYLFHARGSLFELETQLLLAKQLQYISGDDSAALLQSVALVARGLTGLINSLTAQVGKVS